MKSKTDLPESVVTERQASSKPSNFVMSEQNNINASYSEVPDDLSSGEILSKILSHPEFHSFKKVAEDDYRNTHERNPSTSLSSKGLYNHKTQEGRSLKQVAMSLGLFTPIKKSNKIDPRLIYDKSTCSKSDQELILKYFSEVRGIYDFRLEDLLSLELRLNLFKGATAIVYPIKNNENSIVQIGQIQIDRMTAKKVKKRIFGSGIREDKALIFGEAMEGKTFILEGIEKGLAFYIATKRMHRIIVTSGTSNFNKISSFIKGGDVIAIIDNDQENQSLKKSKDFPNHVKVLMPRELGVDADDALKKGDFDKWFSSLEVIKREEKKFFDGYDQSELSSQSSHELSSIEDAASVVNSVLEKGENDPGLYASPEFLDALKYIREESNQDWFRYRDKIKKHKPSGILLGNIEQLSSPVAEDSDNEHKSLADELVELVLSKGTLFHDEMQTPYLTVKDNPVEKTFSLNSTSFRDWLSCEYFIFTKSDHCIGKSASETSIKQAITTLSGFAKFEGDEQSVFLRVGHNKECYFLFIGDSDWRAVKLGKSKWSIEENCPVKFWSPKSQKELPYPVEEGDYNLLWDFCNISSYEDQYLVLAWILECFRSDTPFPILSLYGAQGTAKSSTQDKIRQIVDPSAVNLRSAFKSTQDLFVSARNNWLCSFNNISSFSAEEQDALCCISTGGGYSSRELYTNSEESLFDIKRPVIMNSIPRVLTAQDAIDRSIQIELLPISFQEESILKSEWEKKYPIILSGILNLFTKALEKLDELEFDSNLPRMADFAKLGEAMVQSIGEEPNSFLKIFEKNRQESIEQGIESCPVASLLRDNKNKMGGKDSFIFEGTMKQLLTYLQSSSSESYNLPKSPKALGITLRRQEPALAKIGIYIQITKPQRDGVHVKITT